MKLSFEDYELITHSFCYSEASRNGGGIHALIL